MKIRGSPNFDSGAIPIICFIPFNDLDSPEFLGQIFVVLCHRPYHDKNHQESEDKLTAPIPVEEPEAELKEEKKKEEEAKINEAVEKLKTLVLTNGLPKTDMALFGIKCPYCGKSDRIRELEERMEVSPLLVDTGVDGAEGNPFFVEELIKMLIDDGLIVAGQERWHVELDRLSKAQVPSTLTITSSVTAELTPSSTDISKM